MFSDSIVHYFDIKIEINIFYRMKYLKDVANLNYR